MAADAKGEMKDLLSQTDIYETKIKTFGELGRNFEKTSERRVTSTDLSDLAKYIYYQYKLTALKFSGISSGSFRISPIRLYDIRILSTY